MPVSLYQKYRPKRFDQIVGQQHVVKILQAEIAQNKLAHAYIFIGPRGTGKTTTARIFANAVNCKNPDTNGNPCGKCGVCKAVAENRFLDLIEIDAASNRGVDNIRELREKVNLAPVMGKYKVYIIDEVHMLTKEAFNALLKTLEEPPEHVIFILATTEPHKIPSTIMSRCERFVFHLASKQELEALLDSILRQEGVKIEEKAKDLIVMQANGSFRDMLSVLDPILSASQNNKITTELVISMLGLFDDTLVKGFIKAVFSLDLNKINKSLLEIEKRAGNIANFMQVLINQVREDIINFHKNKKLPAYYLNASYNDLVKFLSLLVNQYTQIRFLFTEILALQLAVYEFLSYKLSGSSRFIQENYSDSLVEQVEQEIKGQTEVGIVQKNAVDVTNNFADSTLSGGGVRNQDSAGQDVKLDSTDLDFSFALGIEESADAENSVSLDSRKNDSGKQVQANTGGDISSAVNVADNDVSFDTIKDKWQDFLNEVKKQHGPLYAILRVSKLLGASINDSGNLQVRIGVPYDYHKKKLEDSATRKLLGDIFSKVFNASITLLAIVNENLKKELLKVSTNQIQNSTAKIDRLPKQKQANSTEDVIADVFGDELDV